MGLARRAKGAHLPESPLKASTWVSGRRLFGCLRGESVSAPPTATLLGGKPESPEKALTEGNFIYEPHYRISGFCLGCRGRRGRLLWVHPYLAFVFFGAAAIIALSLKMANAWQKFVILRMGKLQSVRGA